MVSTDVVSPFVVTIINMERLRSFFPFPALRGHGGLDSALIPVSVSPTQTHFLGFLSQQ